MSDRKSYVDWDIWLYRRRMALSMGARYLRHLDEEASVLDYRIWKMVDELGREEVSDLDRYYVFIDSRVALCAHCGRRGWKILLDVGNLPERVADILVDAFDEHVTGGPGYKRFGKEHLDWGRKGDFYIKVLRKSMINVVIEIGGDTVGRVEGTEIVLDAKKEETDGT